MGHFHLFLAHCAAWDPSQIDGLEKTKPDMVLNMILSTRKVVLFTNNPRQKIPSILFKPHKFLSAERNEGSSVLLSLKIPLSTINMDSSNIQYSRVYVVTISVSNILKLAFVHSLAFMTLTSWPSSQLKAKVSHRYSNLKMFCFKYLTF